MVVKKGVGRADETERIRLQNIQIGGKWRRMRAATRKNLKNYRNNRIKLKILQSSASKEAESFFRSLVSLFFRLLGKASAANPPRPRSGKWRLLSTVPRIPVSNLALPHLHHAEVFSPPNSSSPP
jgi:hypothetical protein